MKKQKEQSFSVHILRISIIASALSILVVGAYIFLEFKSQRNEKFFMAGSKLIIASEHQAATVAASLLVKEEYDAIDLLKKDIQSQENLDSVEVGTHAPDLSTWSGSQCRTYEDGGIACIDAEKQQIATLFQVKLGQETIGFLIKRKTIEAQVGRELQTSMLALLAGLVFSTLIIFLFGRNFIYKRIRNPLLQMVDDIEPAVASGSFKEVDSYGVREVEMLAEKLQKLVLRLKTSQTKLVASEKDAAVGQIAAQVSHDIRSPLAALEMISESLKGMDEDKRLILRNSITRIRDIANSLVLKNKVAHASEETILEESTKQTESPAEVALLAPLIETIVSEKRMQYRSRLNISIEFTQTTESYGLFCKVGPISFQRMISNLIDNSIEAMRGEKQGFVKITLKAVGSSDAEIQVSDNGYGIREDFLAKIGTRGFTLGKTNGSGLGVFHAKECVKAWGGQFDIQSKVNHGTTITLTFQKQAAPAWFVPKLVLSPGAKVIVFDDDQSIHQIWDERLKSNFSADHEIEVLHFSAPNDVRKYYGQNFQEQSNDVYLMDYEILGTSETGLDLIRSLGIQEQAILVTSHYENAAIRDMCKSLNVRMIPKPMSGFVPVEKTADLSCL